MPERKHIRWRGFDYSSASAYFITICVKDHCHWLGEIKNGIMCFSEVGNIAALYLQQIPEIRNNVLLETFIVMPNHIHFILEITENTSEEIRYNQFGKPLSGSVSMIVNQFKGAVKKWCNQNGYADFEWQGRFHDHVIRNDKEFKAIENYIIDNPVNWNKDKFYT